MAATSTVEPVEITVQQGKFLCELGPFDDIDPVLGVPTVIVIDEYRWQHLLKHGPVERTILGPGYSSVSTEGDNRFLHIDHDGQRATWQLFPAVQKWQSPESPVLAGKRIA